MRITNLLKNAKEKFADKVAFKYQNETLSFEDVYNYSFAVATKIACNSDENKPIVVLSNKNLFIPSIYLGIALSNCFYVPLSTEMPLSRIEEIINFTEAKILIADDSSLEIAKKINFSGQVFTITECINNEIKGDLVDKRERNILDSNPLYVIFTSGSSGTPKGVVTSHNSVTDYVTTFANTFKIDKDEILGNQAPLDYIAGIRDIYLPLAVGCQTVFLQKSLFSTPKLLFEKLNDEKVTTICWVSAALSLCCQLDVFKEIKPQHLRKIFFTGSVLDYKYLNIWTTELPNALFVNHYGPTEITASCTYYEVNNDIKYEKNLPIGKAFENRKVFVINESGQMAKSNEIGEICVSGNCLALGYFKNPEKTKENFVQYPLNESYRELIYKTGDLGYQGDDGNLYFCGRKDNQIKHMGHRVELGEIELSVNKLDGIKESCCLYNEKKSIITLFYSGNATAGEISKFLRQTLPSFMIPRKLIQMENLPKLHNGKIDRQTLKNQF